MRRYLPLVLGLLLPATPALAQKSIATDQARAQARVPLPLPEREDETDHRFEAEMGLGGGVLGVGDDLASMTGGAFLNLGWRMDDFTILAEIGLQILDADNYYETMGPKREGDEIRTGLGLRHTFLNIGPSINFDLAAEVAVERRMIRWTRGGNLNRTAISAAFVMNMDLANLKRGSKREKRHGLHYAIRMGGADAPPGENGIDLTLLFELGMYFGR